MLFVGWVLNVERRWEHCTGRTGDGGELEDSCPLFVSFAIFWGQGWKLWGNMCLEAGWFQGLTKRTPDGKRLGFWGSRGDGRRCRYRENNPRICCWR